VVTLADAKWQKALYALSLRHCAVAVDLREPKNAEDALLLTAR
jgi:hypothetical protein